MRIGCIVLLIALGASSARGEDPDEEIARAHFQTGLTYYDSDRFAPAVKEFLEAYRLSHRPALLFNIARSYEKLDDAGRATFYYKRYLEALPKAPEKHQIQNTLARLAPRTGTLAIHCAVAGAEVLVDDEVIGLAPVDPQILTAGRHHVEVRYPGYVAATRDVEVKGAGTAEVRLDPTPAIVINTPNPTVPEPVKPVEPRPTPSVVPPQPLVPTPPPAAPVVEKKKDERRWVGPVIGISVGVAVAAAVAVILALTLGGTDFSAQARQNCMMSPNCQLVQP